MKRIMPSVVLAVALPTLALLAAGCDDDDNPLTPIRPHDTPLFTGYIRATIDGQPFEADEYLNAYQGLSDERYGHIRISAVDDKNTRKFELSLSFVTGPGTYPLGVNPETTPGGRGIFLRESGDRWDMWMTPSNGNAGSITITVRTEDRIAGNFHFIADEVFSVSGPTKISVAGEFDITARDGLPPLPKGVGSTFTGTVGGAAFTAGMVVGTARTTDTFEIDADDTRYVFEIRSLLPVAALNNYGIPSQIEITLKERGTANTWGGTLADVGELTVMEKDSNWLVAGFSATLEPVAAPAPIMVNGLIHSYLDQPASASIHAATSAR